jgi:hypothetical protein
MRSRNHRCSEQAISIIYSVCGFVALSMKHEIHTRHIVMWPARLYNIFPHYLLNGTTFGKTLLNVKCVLIFLRHFSS